MQRKKYSWCTVTSTTWPLASVRIGKCKSSTNEQSIGWVDVYPWASHEVLSLFPGLVLCRTGTFWLHFCQCPFLSPFLFAISLGVHFFPFRLNLSWTTFFLGKLVCIFSPKIHLILLCAVHISNLLSLFVLSLGLAWCLAYISFQCCHDFRVATEQARSMLPSIMGKKGGEKRKKSQREEK